MIIIFRHIHIGTGRADGRGAHARRGAAGADHAARNDGRKARGRRGAAESGRGRKHRPAPHAPYPRREARETRRGGATQGSEDSRRRVHRDAQGAALREGSTGACGEGARLARARDRALSEANTARAELKRASTKHADADGARWALESRATALQLELDAVLRAQADAAEAHRVEIDAHAKQLDELQEREVRCVTLRVCFLLPQIFLPAPSSHTIAPPLLSFSPSLTETRAGQGLRTQGEARAAGANDDAAPTTSPRRWVDPSWRRAAPRRPDVGGRAYHLSRWSADTRVGALARHRARLIEGR